MADFEKWWAENYGDVGEARFEAPTETIKRMLEDAFAAGGLAEGLWRCGCGHVAEVDLGTPPYDMPSCPVCAALEGHERLRAELRENFDLYQDDRGVLKIDGVFPLAASKLPELRAALEGRDP